MKKNPAAQERFLSGRYANRLFQTEPLVEVVDNRRVLIENHQGIISYGSEEICTKVRHGCVSVTGTGMELACMTKEKLVIVGNIYSVRMTRGGRL